jgi:hypothetical protein
LTGVAERILITARGGRPVGQGAVEKDVPCVVDGGDIDEGIVEVGAVSDDIAQELRVTVLVTSAHGIGIAAAGDLCRLVLPARLVVVAIRTRVRIRVGTVEPQAGPECESSDADTEEKGVDA